MTDRERNSRETASEKGHEAADLPAAPPFLPTGPSLGSPTRPGLHEELESSFCTPGPLTSPPNSHPPEAHSHREADESPGPCSSQAAGPDLQGPDRSGSLTISPSLCSPPRSLSLTLLGSLLLLISTVDLFSPRTFAHASPSENALLSDICGLFPSLPGLRSNAPSVRPALTLI